MTSSASRMRRRRLHAVPTIARRLDRSGPRARVLGGDRSGLLQPLYGAREGTVVGWAIAALSRRREARSSSEPRGGRHRAIRVPTFRRRLRFVRFVLALRRRLPFGSGGGAGRQAVSFLSLLAGRCSHCRRFASRRPRLWRRRVVVVVVLLLLMLQCPRCGFRCDAVLPTIGLRWRMLLCGSGGRRVAAVPAPAAAAARSRPVGIDRSPPRRLPRQRLRRRRI